MKPLSVGDRAKQIEEAAQVNEKRCSECGHLNCHHDQNPPPSGEAHRSLEKIRSLLTPKEKAE